MDQDTSVLRAERSFYKRVNRRVDINVIVLVFSHVQYHAVVTSSRVRVSVVSATSEDKGCYVIIITYIYHALINALSAQMIHSNLNMIFYTHVEHSPTNTIYIKYYKK